MADRTRILRCFARATALFLVMVAAWPLVAGAYRTAYATAAQSLLLSVGGRSEVLIAPIVPVNGRDVEMRMRNLDSNAMRVRHISSRFSGYMPATLLLAAIIATPIEWRRRLRALGLGMIVLHAWLGATLILTVVLSFSRDDPLRAFAVPAAVRTVLEVVVRHTVSSPALAPAVPLLIWALVAGRPFLHSPGQDPGRRGPAHPAGSSRKIVGAGR
ncbi:MAG: hypothetical protein KF817_07410 [Phycisphaeraceae bacterium]|nr:hypothetical protein [Phycisphaeraceae bacterium]